MLHAGILAAIPHTFLINPTLKLVTEAFLFYL